MLASMLLESAGAFGVPNSYLSKYDHEHGAALIAMESAEDMRDLFETCFIQFEQAEVIAHVNGDSVVTEGFFDAIKSGFEKIKEKVKQLWEKVKAFFHNVRRFFDGLFMNGKDFATKYEKELKKLNLRGYKYHMYDYSNLDKMLDLVQKGYVKVMASIVGAITNEIEYTEDMFKQKFDEDKIVDLQIKSYGLNANDEEDLREEVWCFCRGVNSYGDEPDEMNVDISDVVNTLKNSGKAMTALDSAQKASDKVFKQVISGIDKFANKVEKDNPKSDSVKNARVVTSALSKCQSIDNSVWTVIKTAKSEQLKVYKSVCVKAFKFKPEK